MKKWVGLIVNAWKSKGGVHDSGNYRGHDTTLASRPTETVREAFRHKDQENSRM